MTFSKTITAAVAAAIMLVSLAVPAFAQNRWVEIINDTGYTIVEFYASNVGAPTWGSDILGYDVIGPYSSWDINFNDGSGYCVFDIKAVFNDGDVLESQINACEVSSHRYY